MQNKFFEEFCMNSDLGDSICGTIIYNDRENIFKKFFSTSEHFASASC
jgi:hypothetical protein